MIYRWLMRLLVRRWWNKHMDSGSRACVTWCEEDDRHGDEGANHQDDQQSNGNPFPVPLRRTPPTQVLQRERERERERERQRVREENMYKKCLSHCFSSIRGNKREFYRLVLQVSPIVSTWGGAAPNCHLHMWTKIRSQCKPPQNKPTMSGWIEKILYKHHILVFFKTCNNSSFIPLPAVYTQNQVTSITLITTWQDPRFSQNWRSLSDEVLKKQVQSPSFPVCLDNHDLDNGESVQMRRRTLQQYVFHFLSVQGFNLVICSPLL